MEPIADAASIRFDTPIPQSWLFGLNPNTRGFRRRIVLGAAALFLACALAGILGCALSLNSMLSPVTGLMLCAASFAGVVAIQWLSFHTEICYACGACTKGPFARQRETWCPGCDNLNDTSQLGLHVSYVLDLSQPGYCYPSDPVARFLALCVYLAIVDKGHEITFEPGEDIYHVRIAIGDEVFELEHPPLRIQFRVAQTLKTLAGVDPSNCGKGQKGHLDMKMPDRVVSANVLVQPTQYGQKVVLRWELPAGTETATECHVGNG